MDTLSPFQAENLSAESTLRLKAPPRPRGPWWLEIGGSVQQEQRCLESGQSLSIGSGPGVDVRLEDPAVSARHALIQAKDGRVSIQDLGSTNGVYVGRARVFEACLTGRRSTFLVGRTPITVRQADSETPGNDEPLPGLIGSSTPMRRLASLVRRAAPLSAPVLIVGESGTGKDVVARALHDFGQRQGRYLAVNCGALPDGLVDSELFGHRRGAFTGAQVSRVGVFEWANKGTLFLDEVAELSPGVQAKLLRVVEDGWVSPVGANDGVKVSTRLITATWAPLLERVELGQFRGDLLHRISTFVVSLPPLRKRKSDLPALSAFWLGRYEPEFGTKTLSQAALARLIEHEWPGNVRELGSVLYRAAAAAEGEVIEEPDLQLGSSQGTSANQRSGEPLSPERVLEILESHGGNMSRAARSARIARSTFRAWVAKAERAREASRTASGQELGS